MDVHSYDLAFSKDEIARFFIQSIQLELDSSDLSELASRTEGWIAGLQLVALSLEKGENIKSIIPMLNGTHYYIAEYLVSEVLENQSPEIQNFFAWYINP
jgi:LuxR family maltose regulon positive regulatory protein